MSAPAEGSVVGGLQGAALFQSLSAEQHQRLAGYGQTLEFVAEQPIFAEGDPPDGLYVVLDGLVRISGVDEDGETLELAQVAAGGFFGELALLDNAPRSGSAAAMVPSRLFRLGQPEFLDFAVSSRAVVVELFGELSRRVRETNSRAIEATLRKRRMRDQLELERLRALSELVAGIAHEVNTPLGVAVTALSVIDRVLADPAWNAQASADLVNCGEDIQDATRLLRKNIFRAHDLVKSFKNLSVRQLTDAVETVQIPEVVREALRLFEPQSRQANLDIRFSCELSGADAAWRGYPGHLTGIVLNLLQNIDRYAYPDRMGGVVDIELAWAGASVAEGFSLVVRDHGRGIAEDDLARIFDPFFTTGRINGGTGLGLAIVKNLMQDALSGSVSVHSAVGAGTSFSLKLPQL